VFFKLFLKNFDLDFRSIHMLLLASNLNKIKLSKYFGINQCWCTNSILWASNIRLIVFYGTFRFIVLNQVELAMHEETKHIIELLI
jgi:hypothetical protein